MPWASPMPTRLRMPMSLTDTSSRPCYYETVALNITSRCNLRCLHCYNGSGEDSRQDMDRAALLRAADALLSLKPFNLCLCGGEPLCCPDLLPLLDYLHTRVPRISMVTNGFALDEAWARTLAAHGANAVQVSLDGAYAWQHDSLRGVAGSFDRAVKAIRALKSANIEQVVCAILPNRLNVDSLEEYVQLCISLGVDIIRAMPFLPSGRGRSMGRPLMLDEEGYFRFRRSLWRLSQRYGSRIRIEWDDPLHVIISMPGRMGTEEKEPMLEIRADGQLALTSYLPILMGDSTCQGAFANLQAAFAAARRDPRVRNYVCAIHNVYDWDVLDPLPYGGESIQLHLLEGTT